MTGNLEPDINDLFSDLYVGETRIHPCFIPSSIYYSFYWPEMGNYGIPDSREISFSDADPVRFQLAGYFEDDPAKPVYYIKRVTDDTCLSLTVGGAAFTKNHSSAYQQWLISKLDTEKYCLILPAVQGSYVIRPFTQQGTRFLWFTRSRDVKHISSVAIYMRET